MTDSLEQPHDGIEVPTITTNGTAAPQPSAGQVGEIPKSIAEPAAAAPDHAEAEKLARRHLTLVHLGSEHHAICRAYLALLERGSDD